jgi:hypothetical protein
LFTGATNAVAGGGPDVSPGICHQTDADLKRFFEDRARRTLQYLELAPRVNAGADGHDTQLAALRADGAFVLPQFFARDAVVQLGARVDALIEEARHLEPLKDRARKVFGAASEGFPLRDRASSIGIADPLVHLPEAIPVAFDSRVLALASAYFMTVPMLSYAKVRKSFVNAIPPSPTQQFHVDIGTYSIFKLLVYLNDVEAGGGPFCYVLGSHRRKFAGWDAKRYSAEEMADHYGPDRVVRYDARAGDAIVVESAGFHGGEKPAVSDRRILILNYTVHPEYGFDYPPVRMRRSDFDSLSPYAQAVADHVQLVD